MTAPIEESTQQEEVGNGTAQADQQVIAEAASPMNGVKLAQQQQLKMESDSTGKFLYSQKTIDKTFLDPLCFLRCRGLPYSANENDVRKFFGGSILLTFFRIQLISSCLMTRKAFNCLTCKICIELMILY